MTHVIQIFKSSKTFNKSNYTEKNRKLFNSLPNSFESTTGFDEDRTLHLPIEYKNYPGLESSSLIIIQDFSGFNPFTLTKVDISVILTPCSGHVDPPHRFWFKEQVT